MDRGFFISAWSKGLKLKSLMFLTNTQIFTSQNINRWTGVVWITVMFYQLFGLLFWRHPFTAEHPLGEQVIKAKSNNVFSKCSFFWVNIFYQLTRLSIQIVQFVSENASIGISGLLSHWHLRGWPSKACRYLKMDTVLPIMICLLKWKAHWAVTLVHTCWWSGWAWVHRHCGGICFSRLRPPTLSCQRHCSHPMRDHPQLSLPFQKHPGRNNSSQVCF